MLLPMPIQTRKQFPYSVVFPGDRTVMPLGENHVEDCEAVRHCTGARFEPKQHSRLSKE